MGLSGFARRKARVDAGLSRYTPAEVAARRRYARARERRLLDEIAALKIASGCTDCGYREHAEALDFDHLPGEMKVAGIAQMLRGRRARDVVLAEVAKCEVVCANCHRVRTATRRLESP